MTQSLDRFFPMILEGDVAGASALVPADATIDDPMFDRGPASTSVARLADWLRARRAPGGAPVRPLRSFANGQRAVIECALPLADGLAWNQALAREEPAPRFDLCVAVVGDRAPSGPTPFSALRVYFGTWSVTGGKTRMRVGPVAPDEREATRNVIASMPIVDRYLDCLARGDAAIADCFEPDGYFREPAGNYACGGAQLADHFQHILQLGGVGVEFLTAIREKDTVGFELQTVKWGKKEMPVPQAGFASYDLGENGLLRGGRVYDSVVPPEM